MEPDDQRRDTLVTAIYQLDPFGPLGGRGRSLESYFPSLASVAALDAGLVVYTEPESIEWVASELHQFNIPSKVIGRDLATVPRISEIQEIRLRKQVHLQPIRDRCHALCHSKLSWLVEQVNANPFGSTRFYWIDAGLAHGGLFPARYLPPVGGARCSLFTPRVLDVLAGDGPAPGPAECVPPLVMLGRPVEGSQLYGIPLEVHAPFVGSDAPTASWHIVGGFFGGSPESLRMLNREYQEILGGLLAGDWLGTEENVLTILHQRHAASTNLLTFTTWYTEDSDLYIPESGAIPFYRIFETLAGRSGTEDRIPADAWYPRSVTELQWHEVDGAFVVSSGRDNRTHVLSNIGVILLELSNGRHSVAEMVSILQQAFHLDVAPEAEVRAFLDQACREDLLV